MRRFLLFTAIAGFAAFPANAKDGASPLCPYYGGHVDVEGKYGSRRHIGETSIFLPVACTEDKLLFSDLRFKGDDKSNREGNAGLGVRLLREEGILGSYAYFDRKLSGESNKYHNQATFGAEWLSENWEVRSNAYIPLSGEKTIGSTDASLRPVLSGSGIFIEETAGATIKEEGLYGGDIEAGFKIPDARTWLHAGAFSFAGKDSASLDGVRARATFNLTENIALTAEGQYDDERGRQGWIGARLTIPFGGPAKKNEGLKARMTASPVRDVDIVTDVNEESSGTTRTYAVNNAATGTAQRILYVDNSNASSGDGTAENPYNTLAAAEAAMVDNDVVYIRSGDGTIAGMDSGLSVMRNNVQIIGSGTAFVYDGARFTAPTASVRNGTVLIAAGAKPVVTNTTPGDSGITIGGMNTLVAGLTINGASRHGIDVGGWGVDIGDVTLENIDILNSGDNGLNINGAAGAVVGNIRALDLTLHGNAFYGARIDVDDTTAETIELTNIDANGNNRAGMRLGVSWGATVDNILLDTFTSTQNADGALEVVTYGTGTRLTAMTATNITSINDIGLGIMFWARDDSDMDNLDLRNIHVEDNQNGSALTLMTDDGRINNASVENIRLINSASTGFEARSYDSTGEINNLRITNAEISDSGWLGLSLNTDNGATLSASMFNSRIAANNDIALYNGGTSLVVDFGSGSEGYNSIESTLYLAIDGGVLNAQNNWWGQSGGPRTGPDQIRNANSGNCPDECGAADTAGALSSDPN